MRLRAIVVKEFIELRRMGTWNLRVFIPVILLAVALGGLSWITYQVSPAAWAWTLIVFVPALPAFFAAYFASESIVGERERHTLETLLASPVDGHEVLFGKVLAHVALYGVLSFLAFLLGWGAALPGASEFPLPTAGAILASFVLVVHVFLLSETVGLFAGQRARTVMAANSVIAPFFAVPFMALVILPVAGGSFLEAAEAPLAGTVWATVGIVVLGVYVVVIPLAILILRKARADRILA